MKIYISHNFPDRILDILDRTVKKQWKPEKVLYERNPILKGDAGFLYLPDGMIMIRFKNHELTFGEIDREVINAAITKTKLSQA